MSVAATMTDRTCHEVPLEPGDADLVPVKEFTTFVRNAGKFEDLFELIDRFLEIQIWHT